MKNKKADIRQKVIALKHLEVEKWGEFEIGDFFNVRRGPGGMLFTLNNTSAAYKNKRQIIRNFDIPYLNGSLCIHTYIIAKMRLFSSFRKGGVREADGGFIKAH